MSRSSKSSLLSSPLSLSPSSPSRPSSSSSSSSSSTIYPTLNLFLIIIVSITALFLFQSGFLLKRVQLREKSTCSDVSLSPSSCWIPRSFDRVILIVIDALRYDFVQSEREKNLRGEWKEWKGQMPFTRDLVKRGAFLSKALADPPTTTLQRLKALGTGGLPTFIDASDNFNSDAAVEEDNILSQLTASGRNATLLGDETWLSLYPNGFHRSFAKESFDIHDLHTVDNYILAHLSSEISRPDWSFLIAHFLGVDHAGHKYGPAHIEMGAKLRQMDRVIKDVVSSLSPSDLLIVMGDHGMTTTGDHGGDSDDEIGAAFMAYSPSRSFSPSPPPSSSSSSPSSPPLQQIDLVPSLSLLLDLPIPFSSLGSPIENLFEDEKRRRMAVRLTAMQVDRFTSTYQRVTGGGLGFTLPEEVPSSLSDQRDLLYKLQSSLRSQWTKFSIPLMRIALLVMADAIGALFSPPTIPSLILRQSYLFLLLSLHLSPSPESSPALSLLLISTPLSLIYSLFHIIYRITSTVTLSLPSLLPPFLLLLSFLLPFSNSFIISEPSILLFFISSLLLYSFYLSFSTSSSRTLSLSSLSHLPLLLFSLLLLRLHPLFHRCREEERDCLQYPSPLPFSSLPFDTRINRYLISLLSSTLFYFFFRPSRPSPSSLLSLSSSLLLPSLLLTQLFFSSSLLPDSLSLQSSFHIRSVAQLVYLLSTVSLILSLFSPFSDPLFLPSILRSISIPLYLILGDGLSFPFISLLFLLYRTPALLPNLSSTVVYLSLLLPYAFYYLGHSPTLSSIPWHAAFTGLSGSTAPRWLAASLVFCHLFSPSLLLLPLFPSLLSSPSLSPFIAISMLRVLTSSYAVMHHRRHLMVWKIFAPHWIFSSLSFLVLLLTLSLSILLKRKVHPTQVASKTV
ncbi:hypothetical protein PFISCL1PPCAC_19443 [Pristionchus fissidentatus]|uniref:GPI ethanolamine phosphate transferase 3 n=1 Tax=Pristionchus fissidentatus TaxID=1538716 RepID=A0AAV5WBG9_9BILA|nr:hypothetical protein PFISCL1PPCAC_19443 [Pristionchus fissidentatus]